MNDAELRMLTDESNLVRARAGGDGDGSADRRRQAGGVRRRPVHRGGFFALPAYPLEEVLDPTGAGDSFAGGFLGYLDAHAR